MAVDPVLCSPFSLPDVHWRLDEDNVAVSGCPPVDGRRPSTSFQPPIDQKAPQLQLAVADPKINVLVEEIRVEVGKWREAGYPDATETSRRLLHHWTDVGATKMRPFAAQVEAMETLIWLREGVNRSNRSRQKIEKAARDKNEDVVRLCSKMATGTGKTVVMGMVIAWQTLNHVTLSLAQNVRHTNRFVVVAPGRTVRDRLRVLKPSALDNIYDDMGLVPLDLQNKLAHAKVTVVNYQAFKQRTLALNGDGDRETAEAEVETERESWVDVVRRVLGSVLEGNHRGICVINDEAHHCYKPSESRRNEDDGTSVWFNVIKTLTEMGALGKVDHNGQAHPVLDFSATPWWLDRPSGSNLEMFQWVTSDFGLMEAMESGIAKILRLAVSDDSSHPETQWRNLYKNTAHNHKKLGDYMSQNNGRLPEPLNGAVKSMVADWEKKLRLWQEAADHPPPVIIFVVDNIANAKAIYEYLAGSVAGEGVALPGEFDELSNITPTGGWHKNPRTLLVHSKVGGDDNIPKGMVELLRQAGGVDGEADPEEAVREMLNTVGKQGRVGEHVRCVVAVDMLSEGWDARTVTHIVGFRPFKSRLMCEQVIGRGLRRTDYENFIEAGNGRPRRFEAEYVEVVGIPLDFAPTLSGETTNPKAPAEHTKVHTVKGRENSRISFPHVTGYQRVAPQAKFKLIPSKVEHWSLAPTEAVARTLVTGPAGEAKILGVPTDCDRPRSAQIYLASEVARELTLPEGKQNDHQPGKITLWRSAFKAVQDWLAHPKIECSDVTALVSDSRQIREAVDNILKACVFVDSTQPIQMALLDKQPSHPHTGNVEFETTLKHIYRATKSELSHAACHSELERITAEALDAHPVVDRWVRNLQLCWTIPYWHHTRMRSYTPDFIAVLDCGTNLVLECKGRWDDKATVIKEWVTERWVPAVAGTPGLADQQRKWCYGVIDDCQSVDYQLNGIIDQVKENGNATSSEETS